MDQSLAILNLEREMIKAYIVEDDDGIDYSPIMGGNPTPERWRRYRSHFIEPERITAVKNAIIDAGLVGQCAMQVGNVVFKFSDNGRPWGLSFRAWGDLMDAIVGEKRGYMYYY